MGDRGRKGLAPVLAGLVLLGAACSSDASDSSDSSSGSATTTTGGTTTTTPPVTDVADGRCGTGLPPEVVEAEGGWPLPNGDAGNTRAVVDSPIGSTTIDDLEEVWTYDVPGQATFGNLTTNPVVVDGRVHVGALDGSTHVVDLASGEAVWSERREIGIFGPAGVAVGWGATYGISTATTVVAHDSADGTVLWERDLGVAPGNQVDMAPALVGGCVLVSTQALVAGSRGTLYALDHADGTVVWQVETVPDDFWGNPEVNHGGGAWYPPAVDPDTATSYWGTSNP
ncbi:MAG TPA: PQQ-binding-like beta-propeller repeat protein, partial [Iamia sp.]